MDKKYTWATEEIFDSVEQWNKTFEDISARTDFTRFKGKLGDADTFYECMKAQEEVGRVDSGHKEPSHRII